MSELQAKRCLPCEGGVKPLNQQQVDQLLTQVPLWQLNEARKELSRRYSFKNFHQTMAFVNALAWIAHQENHHPDLELGYNYCLVKFSTHAVEGLTENDFICAAKTDALS